MMSRIVPSIATPQLVLVLGHKRYATKTSSSYQNALLRFRGRRGFTRHLQLSFQTDSMSVGSDANSQLVAIQMNTKEDALAPESTPPIFQPQVTACLRVLVAALSASVKRGSSRRVLRPL
jgi:hypothetical protein